MVVTLGDNYKVAKLITMPNTPNFVNSSFSLIRTVGTTVSPFTGKTKTQEYDGVYWNAAVSLPPMRRDVALNWQSFLLELNGPVNTFKFTDPDALTNRGTYDATALASEIRVNNTSVTLSFTTAGRITASASTFANAIVGDFIVVTGAVNENSTSSCKVRTNVKGATGLSLKASSNSATGTIKKGDYLSIQSAANSTGTPAQLVMVTEDATLTTTSGTDNYAVKTQPKLRSDLASGHFVVFANPKGNFRFIYC